MKLVTIFVAMIFALGAASVSISAQGRGNGQARKTAAAKPAKTQTRTVKTDARAPKAETRATRTTAKADTRTAKTAAKTETRVAKAETKATRTETTAANTTPKQEGRLLAMLPPGTTIQDASLGFRNRGQFIAAVNASNNHDIPFYELKARMTGIPVGSTVPTTTPMSLGQALQSFKVTPPPAPLP
jgi:hypothetical protein